MSASSDDKGSVTTIEFVRKGDTAALLTNGTDSFPEDSYAGSYWTAGSTMPVAILEPQYKPGVLLSFLSLNNVLAQCVEAMEVNIDGTGHTIVEAPTHKDAPEDEGQKRILEDFFAEPYPGKSMSEIRRDIRRDREATGNGYMEVIRSAGGDVTLLNHLDCAEMRLVRMDDPVAVDRVVTRGGREIKLTIRARERRFVQQINGKKIYFKEFGASRDLHRGTGEWHPVGTLPLEDRASEVIHFSANKEPKTPYGVPRWINQLPSVLGSRRAEEHNLDFFESGGLPPVLVIVEGGTLGDTVKADLKRHLSGHGSKNRAAVVEAVSTSGSLESAGQVKVRVERFGSERQQDAMFQQYDKNSKEHVRTAFRLPPLFIGEASDYNFATAYTAYMVAEAQVFFPEREEFDNIINNRICRALGVSKYRFKSLPMTLVDVAKQIQALALSVNGKFVDLEEVVKSLNEITGLSMVYKEPPKEQPPVEGGPNVAPAPLVPELAAGGTPGSQRPVTSLPAPVKASKSDLEMLATKLAIMSKVKKGELSGSESFAVYKAISNLDDDELSVLGDLMTADLLSDQTGLVELCNCASHIS